RERSARTQRDETWMHPSRGTSSRARSRNAALTVPKNNRNIEQIGNEMRLPTMAVSASHATHNVSVVEIATGVTGSPQEITAHVHVHVEARGWPFVRRASRGMGPVCHEWTVIARRITEFQFRISMTPSRGPERS